MKNLLDFLPIILFFVAFKIYGIFTATGVLIIAYLIKMAVTYKKQGRVEKMEIITVAMVLVFGGFTLAFRDETFIKMKPTVLYFIFAMILLAGTFTQRNLMERMLSGKIAGLPSNVFKTLNWLWIVAFIMLSGMNYYVAEHFPTETWVNFKLFGLMGFTFGFILIQALYIAWYVKRNNIQLDEVEVEEG